MQNSHPLYHDSEIPIIIIAFMTNMTISHLHKGQMIGRMDAGVLTC